MSCRRCRRLRCFLINHIARNHGTGHQRVAFVEANDADALRVAADGVDVGCADPLDLAAGGDHQDFVGVDDGKHIDNLAIAGGRLDVSQTLAAAALAAVLVVAGDGGLAFRFRFGFFFVGFDVGRFGSSSVDGQAGDGRCIVSRFFRSVFAGIQFAWPERSTFAVTEFADAQQRPIGIGDHHPHDDFILLQLDALHAARRTAHRTSVFMVEADRHAAGG